MLSSIPGKGDTVVTKNTAYLSCGQQWGVGNDKIKEVQRILEGAKYCVIENECGKKCRACGVFSGMGTMEGLSFEGTWAALGSQESVLEGRKREAREVGSNLIIWVIGGGGTDLRELN